MNSMPPLNFRAGNEDLQPLTGKSWTEWCDLLDARGGATQNLSTTVTYLMMHYGLRRLHAQMIAVYYKHEWRSPQHSA